MVNDFYKLALQTYKERKKQEMWKDLDLDNQARREYAKFCVWSRGYNNSDFSEKSFKRYQREENLQLNFWLKKRIAEMFYGYKFEFNYETHEWKRITNNLQTERSH